MIVKDFLLKLNIDDLVNSYYLYEEDICNYHGTTKQIKGKEDARKYALKKALNEILLLDPIENLDYIIFSVPHPNSQGLDSFLIKKEELFNTELDRIEHYGYEFDSMREILGFGVSDACKFYLNDDLLFACSIIFEMTFFGYNPDDQEKETSKNIDELNNQIEEIECGEANFTTLSDEFWESVGYVDKRDEKERVFEDKVRSVEGNYIKDILDELYDLERYYQNKK